MAELRTGAGSYDYKTPQWEPQKPFDPMGDLQKTNNELKRIADTAEAERTRGRILDYYLPALVNGTMRPESHQLELALTHARNLLKQGSMYTGERNKLEASVNQLEALSNSLQAFMNGKASYADIGAALNNVQVALRAADLLPKSSRNPLNQEAAKVPANYKNREFLLQPKWSPPQWVLESNNKRDTAMVNALDKAADTYRQSPTAQNWKAFEQARNHLNKYFNDSRFLNQQMANQAPGQHNGKVIQSRIVWANKEIGLHSLDQEKAKLDQLEQVYRDKPNKANEDALRKQVELVSNLGYKAGRLGGVLTSSANLLLQSAKPVDSNVADPRDKKGRAQSTFVGAAYPDTAGQYGLKQQTRIVEVKKGVGQAATVSYEARGLYLTDAQGVQRGTPQEKWVQPLTGAKTPQEAIALVQAHFKSGKFRFPPAAITTGSVAPLVPTPMASNERVAPRDASKPLFSTGKAAIYAQPGTFGDNNDKDGKIRAAIDDKIVPSAARFVMQSSQPVQLGQGDTLLNNLGVAMNIPANRVPTVGNPLQYTGEALDTLRKLYNKVVEIGGPQAKLNVLPVYMEQANGQMIMAPLFKIQRADGQGQQYLDSSGRRYDSLQAFKGENKLPCKRLYVPHEGQLVARGADGKPKQLQFDVVDNEHFMDKALTITRGVVGGGSTVLAIGSAVLGGGALVPPLLIGAGVVMAGTAATALWDRVQHGEDLSLADPEVRGYAFDILSSGLGVGSLATAGRVGQILAGADALVGVGQLVDGSQQLVSNRGKISELEWWSQAATLAFFGALAAGGLRKNFTAQAVHDEISAPPSQKTANEQTSTTPEQPAKTPVVAKTPQVSTEPQTPTQATSPSPTGDTVETTPTTPTTPTQPNQPVNNETTTPKTPKKTGVDNTVKPTPKPVGDTTPAANNPQWAQASSRLRKLSINTEGMSSAKPLTPEQIAQITTAAKAAGSYEKAVVVLSDIATVTGIPMNKLAGMKSVGDVLTELKTRPNKPADLTNPKPMEITASSAGSGHTFLSPEYPRSKKPWMDDSNNGYSSSEPALIEAAFAKAKANNPNLQPAPWFRDLFVKEYTQGKLAGTHSDTTLEAFIKRTQPDLVANTPSSVNQPSTAVKQPSRQSTPAERKIDELYAQFKGRNAGEHLGSPGEVTAFRQDMRTYLDEIGDDIAKVNSIYAKSSDFLDTYNSIRDDLGKVSTYKEAEELIRRATLLKFDAHLAEAHGNGRAGDIDDLVPITVAEKEIYERYKAKVAGFGELVDDLKLRSGSAVKARIPGWKGDGNGEVEIFKYDPKQDLLTVNAAAAMDILTTNGELAGEVKRVFGFVGRTGERAGDIPGMITRRVRFVLDKNAPAPQPGADGLVTMPTGRKQTYEMRQVDRDFIRAEGLSEAQAQKEVNYARRWYELADLMMTNNGMTVDEIMFKYAQDSVPNAIGHMNSRLATARLGGATSGIQVTGADATLAWKDDILAWVIKDFNERRNAVNGDPSKPAPYAAGPKVVPVRYPDKIEPEKLSLVKDEVAVTFGAYNTDVGRRQLVINQKNLGLNQQNNVRNWVTWGIGLVATPIGAVIAYNAFDVNRKTSEIGSDITNRINGVRPKDKKKYDPQEITALNKGIELMLNFPPNKEAMLKGKKGADYAQALKQYNEATKNWKSSLPAADWAGKPLTGLEPENWHEKIAEFSNEFGLLAIKSGLTEYFKGNYESLVSRAQKVQLNYTSSDPNVVKEAKKSVPEIQQQLQVLNDQRLFAESWLNGESKSIAAERKIINGAFGTTEVQQQIVKDAAATLDAAVTQLTASSGTAISTVASMTGTASSANIAGKQIDSNNNNTSRQIDTTNKNAAAAQYPGDVRDKLNSEFTPKQSKLADQIVKAQADLVDVLTQFGTNPVVENQTNVVNSVNTLRNLYKNSFNLATTAISYLEAQGKAYQNKNGISNTAIQNEIANWKTVLKDAQSGSIDAGSKIAGTSGALVAFRNAAYNGYEKLLNDANTQLQGQYGQRVSLPLGPNRIRLPPLLDLQGQPRTPLDVAQELFQKYPGLFKPSREAIDGAQLIGIKIQGYQTPEEFVRAAQAAGQWLVPEVTPTAPQLNPTTGNQPIPTPVPTAPLPNVPPVQPKNQPTPGANIGL